VVGPFRTCAIRCTPVRPAMDSVSTFDDADTPGDTAHDATQRLICGELCKADTPRGGAGASSARPPEQVGSPSIGWKLDRASSPATSPSRPRRLSPSVAWSYSAPSSPTTVSAGRIEASSSGDASALPAFYVCAFEVIGPGATISPRAERHRTVPSCGLRRRRPRR
jgi:hypothetical protein